MIFFRERSPILLKRGNFYILGLNNYFSYQFRALLSGFLPGGGWKGSGVGKGRVGWDGSGMGEGRVGRKGWEGRKWGFCREGGGREMG
jgi:hypothetical protein